MADPYTSDLKPMTDGDIGGSPATPEIKQTVDDTANKLAGAREQLSESTAKVREQAGDKARIWADDGKARASGALDQLSTLLTDAAAQVDGKLGQQYGDYARTAAGSVQSFATTLNDKSVDELVEDARGIVRRSPAIAIGTAAAIGFVLARLLSAGVDQHDGRA